MVPEVGRKGIQEKMSEGKMKAGRTVPP